MCIDELTNELVIRFWWSNLSKIVGMRCCFCKPFDEMKKLVTSRLLNWLGKKIDEAQSGKIEKKRRVWNGERDNKCGKME